MPYLDMRHARRLNATLSVFHAQPPTPDLAPRLAVAMADLLGLETVCFDAFAPQGMYHLGGNAPEFFPASQLQEMAGRIGEHPLYHPLVVNHQPAPFKISDYLPTPRYERSDFYQDYYRPLHLVHQLGTVVRVPGQAPISCVLTRTRRDFSETDRLLLALLQPHLLGLFRQAPPAPATPPPPVTADPVAALTPREAEVLHCLARGWPDKEIAHHCRISVRTVQVHLRSIYAKLGVSNRTEASLRVFGRR